MHMSPRVFSDLSSIRAACQRGASQGISKGGRAGQKGHVFRIRHAFSFVPSQRVIQQVIRFDFSMSRTIERNCSRLYGCDYQDALKANDGLPLNARGSFAEAYTKQRHNAGRRGIEWAINFVEWAAAWRESGHWLKRGKRSGCYCMARHGDAGPYRIGNVSIQPMEINCRDALSIARPHIDLSAVAKLRRGTGKGWFFMARQPKHPYQVYVGSTYVGCFSTQAEAEAAYAAAV
jgi:hypothetical protein